MEQQDNNRQETDNSRLARAKRKLGRLKREYSAQISRVFDHQAQTNGQPMNDKENGRSFFNRQEQLEGRARTFLREIEAQEERISMLEHQKERKELGLNNQGGLIMSVDNIPMIKAEIEQAKQGNSMYSAATIRKYEKQLVELEELKRRSERADKHMNEQAQKMIESGRLTQWKKNPMIYFVKGYRKLAVELTESGTFEPSQRYAAKTEAEQSVISDILSELKFNTEEIPNATKDQDAALNHFYRVEFNEGSESIRNFEGEIVSQPLIEEIKRLDRPMESGYYKFYFQEIKDGEIVDAFRLDVGDGVNSTQDYYKKLESLAAQDKTNAVTNERPKEAVKSGKNDAVKKRKSADELKKETDQLVKDAMENIKNHFDDPEDVLELGAFMSKFYNYSLKNTALIQNQLPHAHAVAGAKKFKEAGFFIRKGEKAIRVLAPTTYKCFINEQGRSQSLSKATKLQKEKILKGELKTEERRAFKNVPVFDISQTTATADDLPKIFP
ncbi:MAG: ArdC-like ssDNA-binding domain-containing protein [Enterococcus faecalis]|nr:ArdC-like ssDNA-binding domain-containing protein [Enterococcus faecalis]